MKRALLLVLLFVAALAFAQTFNIGEPQGVRYGTSLPARGNFPGQFFVVIVDATDPIAYMWNGVDEAWEPIAGDAAALVVSSVTSSGAISGTTGTFSGVVSATSVEPSDQAVHRDNFCGLSAVQSDLTPESGVDGEVNLIFTDANSYIYWQRIEQTATLSLARTPNTAGAGCGLDVSGDVTNNDGHEIILVSSPLAGVHIVDSAIDEWYFEISITIGNISGFDGDIAWGLRLPENQQDPPQHDGLNTYFIATLSDNAGDLDFEADVDGGGQVNDDSGITWADGETKVIRFVIDGDGYAASVDGVEITLTNLNAGGSNDFTDGDKVQPFYYHTQGAEGAATGVVINYIEWGFGTLSS